MKTKLSPLFWVGVGYLILLAIFAIFGPTIRYRYDEQIAGPFLMPSSQYWLGTDEVGRDVFSRLAHGARVSLMIALLVQTIAVTVGILVGVLGVFAPKWIRVPLMRFTDGMFAFPDLLLAVLIIGIYGYGSYVVVIALSITAWPSVARLVRTQVATLKDREYVTAAQAMGASTWYLVFKHILPHLWGVLLAVVMVDVAATILSESTLSFLGIGVQAPEPSWGGMINTFNTYKDSKPLFLLWPCLMLSTTIFALNFVGDGLRTLADARAR